MNIHLMMLPASNVFLLLGALMVFLPWQRAGSCKGQRLCCKCSWATLCCRNAPGLAEQGWSENCKAGLKFGYENCTVFAEGLGKYAFLY